MDKLNYLSYYNVVYIYDGDQVASITERFKSHKNKYAISYRKLSQK